MAAHPLVLAIQDTTFLNYTHHPATTGLRPIGGGQRGLLMHSTLAVTSQALPLGVLDQQIWARPEPEKLAKRANRRAIAEKESHKWLTALRENVRWKALYTAIHRRAILPPTPPTVRQAVRWIAQLGGFLGRKGDGEPGITTIWRGWSRLADLVDLYLITHPSEDTGNS